MDISDINREFGITMRKLRIMERAGVLNTGKSSAPVYWQKLRLNIRKGKMSARSVALSYAFPEKLESFAFPTAAEYRVINAHFSEAELPTKNLKLPKFVGWSLPHTIHMASVKNEVGLEELSKVMREIIPDCHVGYLFVSVRILLMCKEDDNVNLAAIYITKAMLNAREHSSMSGWWHKRAGADRKNRTVYHSPDHRYDL